MNQTLTIAAKHWPYIADLVRYPNNEKEYRHLVQRLDELLNVVGSNEDHPLIGLVDVMSNFIASYEEIHHKQPKTKSIDALRFLMVSHQLTQRDLPEIGSQGVVSEVLNGKRKLNVRQIKQLAKRFHVSPSTFIET